MSNRQRCDCQHPVVAWACQSCGGAGRAAHFRLINKPGFVAWRLSRFILEVEMKGCAMRLVQFVSENQVQKVGMVETESIRPIEGLGNLMQLAQQAWSEGSDLATVATRAAGDKLIEYQMLIDKGRLLAPANHPDPAHCLVTGTGPTHLGSAAARDDMHQKLSGDTEENFSDSMRMFKWGIEGGKPPFAEFLKFGFHGLP